MKYCYTTVSGLLVVWWTLKQNIWQSFWTDWKLISSQKSLFCQYIIHLVIQALHCFHPNAACVWNMFIAMNGIMADSCTYGYCCYFSRRGSKNGSHITKPSLNGIILWKECNELFIVFFIKGTYLFSSLLLIPFVFQTKFDVWYLRQAEVHFAVQGGMVLIVLTNSTEFITPWVIQWDSLLYYQWWTLHGIPRNS